MKILVTGATGYIGGRLVPLLLEQGYQVRVLVRDPMRIQGRPWAALVEVAVGDLEDAATAQQALAGCQAAFYLVHSLHSGVDYAERDRLIASNFVAAGKHLNHVVYLGGLMPRAGKGSKHLTSRAEVGKILREGLPTTEFRAGPIIGSGSASFEMVRYLVARVPLMIAPRWILHDIQPIAIRDILKYLVGAVARGPSGIVEIGGDIVTFKQILEVVAPVQGYPRKVIPIPVMTPTLAAEWIHLVTPIPRTVALPLCQGIISNLTADTRRASELFPEVHPITYRYAVELALGKIERGEVETTWSFALGEGPTYELVAWEGLNRETRSVRVPAEPEKVYRTFASLGGDRGWLVWNWAWSIRGFIDQLVGGPGLRRSRRHAHDLLPGESVDFWRVERVVPGRLLRLRAEMKLPGGAWMQWEALPEDGGTRLVQTALFAPNGFWGYVYWVALYPIHGRIFSDLVKAIARAAQR
jgi:uncharacterized protein YbjT (DUF2867 family)